MSRYNKGYSAAIVELREELTRGTVAGKKARLGSTPDTVQVYQWMFFADHDLRRALFEHGYAQGQKARRSAAEATAADLRSLCTWPPPPAALRVNSEPPQ